MVVRKAQSRYRMLGGTFIMIIDYLIGFEKRKNYFNFVLKIRDMM